MLNLLFFLLFSSDWCLMYVKVGMVIKINEEKYKLAMLS